MAAVSDLEPGCLVEIPIRLSLEEVERLTRIVERARLSGQVASPVEDPSGKEAARLAMFARFLLTLRRRRDAAFPLIEFGEPAWDMLLDLYVQHVDGQKTSVSSLCAAAAVPATTALRWLDAMVASGHFVRCRDPQDSRRVRVSLAADTILAVESFLSDMRRRALMALQ